MLLLLNGIGGIGKSTLASYYLNQHKDKFDYYGFVEVNEDIKLSLASAFSTSLDLKSEKIDDLFAEIMNKLQNLEGKKLLIIDDVKEMDNQLDEINTLMTLKNSGFQILFTSREVKENIPQYFLDIMNIEDARELFLKHHTTDEMEKVDKILEYLDYHTLFIEMTAKTLTKRKRTLSLDQMIEKFANGEFASIKKNRNESFNQFLNDLFENDKILKDEETLLFLKRLSVLPSIEISFEDLYKFLVCEDEERLEEFLIELVDNGWLIESDGGYKFHQILKEFVFDSYLALFDEIETQIDYFNVLVKNSDDVQVAVDNRENTIYFENLNKILNKMEIENEKVAEFCNNFGLIYHHLGIYYQAKLLYLKALKIFDVMLGDSHPYIAVSYNNLAEIYISMGEYQKVEPLLLKALRMRINLIGEEHPDTATSYNNLAEFYRLLAKYQKAETFHVKALEIRKKILGEEHFDTATSYNNLALLYNLMEKYKKSEYLHLKALEIRENLLEETHPDTVSSYNNLAGLYESIGEYQKAKLLYLKALKILEKILRGEHPNIASCYNNLAGLYQSMEEYQEAKFFYLKALNMRKKLLGKEHPDIALSYNDLAVFYYSQKQYQQSYTFIKKAIVLWENILPVEHPSLLQAKKNLQIVEKQLTFNTVQDYSIQSVNNINYRG